MYEFIIIIIINNNNNNKKENNHNARKTNFWKEQYNQDRMNLEDE